jgi:hypothetical protein
MSIVWSIGLVSVRVYGLEICPRNKSHFFATAIFEGSGFFRFVFSQKVWWCAWPIMGVVPDATYPPPLHSKTRKTLLHKALRHFQPLRHPVD